MQEKQFDWHTPQKLSPYAFLFIIGKGHEETQVYKNITRKFSDIEESIKIAKNINF